MIKTYSKDIERELKEFESVSVSGVNFEDEGLVNVVKIAVYPIFENDEGKKIIGTVKTEIIVSERNAGQSGGGNSPPVASFTMLLNYDSKAVTFQSTSTDSDGTIVSCSWNFGDGETSNVCNPVHIYNSFGTYSVILTVTDNLGATGNYANNDVKVIGCGDNLINGLEQCDDGKNGDDTDSCTDACRFTYCGDGIVQSTNGLGQGESCDDGDNDDNPNDDINDGPCVIDPNCGNSQCMCSISWCGDGYLDTTKEECDGGYYGDLDCTDYGYAGGNLGCLSNCDLDFNLCFG